MNRLAPMFRTATLAALMLLGAMLAADGAAAEAYLAMHDGYKCSQCHFNKTGGGKRNDFANTYVQTSLAQHFVEWLPPGEEASESAVGNIYHGRLNDFVSLGADFRFRYAERRTPNVDKAERDLAVSSGLLYVQMDMVPGRASLYLDQTVSGTSTSRELFVLFDELPLASYLKVGRFFLASGFRLLDDTAFVRQYPGYTYGNPDTGIEYGIEPGPFSMGLWSTSVNKKKGLIASYITRPGRIGFSFNVDSSVEGTKKTVGNVFGGVHLGRFTFLGEIDRIQTETTTETTGVASLLEVNYMISKGGNLKLSDEGYDPDIHADPDRVERISLVYEPFVTQFMQLIFGVRSYIGQTNNDVENRKEFFIEVHTFFY